MATASKKISKMKITLTLDPVFYPKRAIMQAKDAFSALAKIDIKKDGKTFVIKFSEVDQDVADNLPDEFANYILALISQQE